MGLYRGSIFYILPALWEAPQILALPSGEMINMNLSNVDLRWTPHPVIVTIRDNRDYIRVLLNSYYTTITGWGVLLR